MSNPNGADTPYSVLGKIHDFKSKGITNLIRYISPNSSTFPNKCLTGEEIAAIHSVEGMKIGMVWETMGDHVGFFSAQQGQSDASKVLAFLKAHNVPNFDTQNNPLGIFFAVDFDASEDDVNGPIMEYFTVVHNALRAAGYLTGVYGSGYVTNAIVSAGYAHYAWVAQSTGWSGYAAGKALADIIQGPTQNICGIDCDTNVVVNEKCLW